jgi:hypothetical protein
MSSASFRFETRAEQWVPRANAFEKEQGMWDTRDDLYVKQRLPAVLREQCLEPSGVSRRPVQYRYRGMNGE